MICPKGQAPTSATLAHINKQFIRDEEFVLSAILQQKLNDSQDQTTTEQNESDILNDEVDILNNESEDDVDSLE
jgi:hypothetical protein